MDAITKVSFTCESRHEVGDKVYIYVNDSLKPTNIQKINFEVDTGGYTTSYITELGAFYAHTSIILNEEEMQILHASTGLDCMLEGSKRVFKAVKVFGWHFLKIDMVILPVDASALTFL